LSVRPGISMYYYVFHCSLVFTSISQHKYIINNKYILCYVDIEDYNATSMYMQSISPITSGIDGRIQFKRDVNNEKSAGFNINTWNYQILVTTFITTVLYLTLK